MVELFLLAGLVGFSLLALILSALAFGFTVYTFIRIRAWEKTETKVIQVDKDSNGFDELNKQMESLKQGMTMDLRDVGYNTDELV